MRRLLPVLAVVLVLGIALPAQAGSLDFRLGGFFPRADTGSRTENNFDLFKDVSTLYTRDGRDIKKSDWAGFSGGAQYNFKIARYVELGVGIDGYSRTFDTEYRDYERDNGRPIRQTLKLDIVPISAEVRFTTTRRYARVAPFVGIGADLFYWKYEEFGDFVNFRDATLPVKEDSFISDGVTPGFHVSGGIRFGITDDIGVVAQGRHQWGSSNMGKGFRDDFPDNKLDLTGWTATIGVNFRF
jgi:hypothetical protein